jgi:thioredoxin 1
MRTLTWILLLIFLGTLSFQACAVEKKKAAGKATKAEAAKPKTPPAPKKLPVLLDFGRGVCIPCKRMKPILEEMIKECEGKAVIRIVEIDHERELTEKNKIIMIPTQVFFDTTGKEVYRHVGFFEKDSMRAHLRALGTVCESPK